MSLPSRPRRALMAAALGLGAVLALGGCAGMNTLHSEVTSFGDWPAGRNPGTYAFERLPSQQAPAQAERQTELEAAAAAALLKAGFQPVAAEAEPDVIVQLGARVGTAERSPWDEPFWWRGPGRWRLSPWNGAWYGGPWRPWPMTPAGTDHYQREVAVLLRDRASGRPLFEAHASTTGLSEGSKGTWAAMFEASLQEFPRSDNQVHTVRTQIPSP